MEKRGTKTDGERSRVVGIHKWPWTIPTLEQKQTAWKRERNNAELTLLSNRIGDYWYISQGKTRIPGVNDAADMEETDVSPTPGCAKKSRPTFHVAFHLPFPPPSPSSSFFCLSFSSNRRRAMEKVGPRFSSPPRAPPAKACCRRNRGAGRLGEERNRKDWIRDEKRFEPPRHPLPDQLRLTFSLSPAFLSARFAPNIRSNRESIYTIGICVYNDIEF